MVRHYQGIHRLHVLLQLLHVSLELRAPVLEPRDHLGVAKAQLGRDLVAVRGAQILLVQETFLQLEYLLVREGRPAFPLLLGLLSVIEEVQVVGLFYNKKRPRTELAQVFLFSGNSGLFLFRGWNPNE